MTLSLGKKLFLYTSVTVVLLLLATFLVLERSQSRQWEEYLRSQSISFARFATPELLKLFRGSFPPPRDADLSAVFDFLGFNRDLIEFSLVSPGGRLLFRSPRFPDFIDLSLPSEALPDAGDRLRTPRVTAQTFEFPGGGRVLDLIAPAFGPTGEHVLSARYLISYDSVDERLVGVRNHFFRLGVIAVCVSLLLVALVARKVTQPIKVLTRVARGIARGESVEQISARGGDELATLALAFNEMTESLARHRRQLTEKNVALQEANLELLQVQEQLIRAERLAAIGQLAAGVSHEIDNPVGIILGYAELLLEDMEEGDPRREDLLAIIEECRRCRRITGGLLGLARTEAHRREPVDLAALLEETLASLRPQKLFRRLSLVVRVEGAPALVYGDVGQLRQVLINLLLNAAQATGGQGEVKLTLVGKKEDVILEVADSGPGIPEALREKIFDPFFTTKGKGEGTGLGLTVCRKLVEDHGGRLSADVAETGGGLLRLSLPRNLDEKYFDKFRDDSLG